MAIEFGSTKAFFCGHDYLNNAHIDYRGIKLCYSTKTGINVYSRQDSIGGVLITVNSSEDYTVERVLI